jgi:NAD+ synthase (glutamine-hydrolysing)
MKICLAQIEVIPCRPDHNFKKMTEAITEAKNKQADMIIFSELGIPGYLIGDTWEELAFIKDCVDYGEEVRELADNIIIIFGNVAVEPNLTNNDGRVRKYNALFCARNKIFVTFPDYKNFYVKTLLPNYREFEEPRHFTNSEKASNLIIPKEHFKESYFEPRLIKETFIGFFICEDGWSDSYDIDPIEEYVKNSADLVISINASPFTIGKNKCRNRTFGEGHAKKKKVPLIYVNCVGIQNNGKNIFTFDGSSVAYNKKGEIVAHAPMFQECLLYVDYENGDIKESTIAEIPTTEIEEIEQALLYGMSKFLQACGMKKVTIGISGGIDSAVVAILMAKIIGPENLLLVNMPSKYNSKTTIKIAQQIAMNIGCYYTSVDVDNSVALTKEQIQDKRVYQTNHEGVYIYDSVKVLNLTPFHLENVQARDRSSRILSAIASAWGGVFTCNGNKSEVTVGYCTFYGDMAGFLAPIGDLWKEQVYALGQLYKHLLPKNIFTIPASAELSAEQNVDEGKGDPLIFWYHDRLFQSWMQEWFRNTPEDNLRWYIDKTINEKLKIPEEKSVYGLFPTKAEFCQDLERWYKLFKGLAVAKRVQGAPILSVSRRAYGFDYRETLWGEYLTRGYYKLKESDNGTI